MLRGLAFRPEASRRSLRPPAASERRRRAPPVPSLLEGEDKGEGETPRQARHTDLQTGGGASTRRPFSRAGSPAWRSLCHIRPFPGTSQVVFGPHVGEASVTDWSRSVEAWNRASDGFGSPVRLSVQRKITTTCRRSNSRARMSIDHQKQAGGHSPRPVVIFRYSVTFTHCSASEDFSTASSTAWHFRPS